MNWLIPHIPPLSLLTFPANGCTEQHCLSSQIGWYIGTAIYVTGQFLPLLSVMTAAYVAVRIYQIRRAQR